MSNDKMRSEFEAWYAAHGSHFIGAMFELNYSGAYTYDYTDQAWDAWQAALEHKPEVSQPVALKVIDGKICYKSKADDQSFNMWCPVGYYHGYKDGTKFFASPPDYEALKAENEELKDAVQFVERWANHHAVKPCHTAEEALSWIQHYPSIRAITESYKDGVIPTTRNPYAEIEALKLRVAAYEAEEAVRKRLFHLE